MKHGSAGVLLVSTVLIAGGGGTAAVYGFSAVFWPVFAGLLCFTIGYEILNYGVEHEDVLSGLQSQVWQIASGDIKDPAGLGSVIVLTVGGVAAMSEGMIMFSETILAPAPGLNAMVMSGVLFFGGYMVAHTGLKQEVI